MPKFNANVDVFGRLTGRKFPYQENVLDIQVDATLDPGASPATGARYLITNSAALHANFGTITGVGDDDIVEYDGADFIVIWDASANGEGALVWDEDSSSFYTFNGAAWSQFSAQDELAKVSSNDTTAKYLEDAIVVSDGSNSTNILELSTLNDGGDEDLQIQVDESKIDHDALTNFVANEHVDHSGVSVVAGGQDGLSASNNDLTSNIGLSVDITGTTAETAIADADTILIDDGDGGTLRKMTRANFIGSAAISMGANKITSSATPSTGNDLTNKTYVDGLVNGVSWKDAVRVATTADGALATAYENGDTVDGVVLATGDRILLKDQSTAAENGIYIVAASGAPSRASDMDEAEEFDGSAVFVQEGTANADKGYVQTATVSTVDTDAVSWTQFTGLGQITAGAGLSKSGDTLDVGDAGKGVQVNADDLEFDASEAAGDGLKQNGTSSWILDIEPADFAGSGLEDDGSDNLRIAAAAAGDGLTGGAGSALSVDHDGEGLIFATGQLALELDGGTLAKSATGLKIADGGVDTTQLAADAVDSTKLDYSSTKLRSSVFTWANADGATKAVSHNFATDDVLVEIYDVNKETIFVDSVDRTDTNTVTLTAVSAPPASEDYTVIVSEAAARS